MKTEPTQPPAELAAPPCSPEIALPLLKEGALNALSCVRALCLEVAEKMEHGQERRRIMSVRSEVGLIMDVVEDTAACSTLAFELILALHVRSKGMRAND